MKVLSSSWSWWRPPAQLVLLLASVAAGLLIPRSECAEVSGALGTHGLRALPVGGGAGVASSATGESSGAASGFDKGANSRALPSALPEDVVSGLAHLHELRIIHRDIKPQNVLINIDRCLSAKLSDMGISKRLPEDMSSLGNCTTASGSSGWRAAEQLLHGRQSRPVDLFSLGCVLFFCMTKGKHPFCSHFERDSNILNNRMDLFLVEQIPEAVHLFSLLLNPDPGRRNFSDPEGFDYYFTVRFPKLLIEVYKVMYRCCLEDASLRKYFRGALS